MADYSGLRALVVEDQEAFREAMAYELQSLGFSVATAKEGAEGYQLTKGERFDLILSDIKMPNWDGKRFLQELRKTAAQATPPFAFMTGFADLSIQEAFDLGADAFLGKPINQEKLLAALDLMLQPPDARWTKAAEAAPAKVIKRILSGWGTQELLGTVGFGRRGMFLTLEPSTISIKVNDRVGFDLEFSDGPIGRLLGIGKVVWRRPPSANEKPAVGIEFEFLEEPSRSTILSYIEAQQPTAAIPQRNGAN